jgi:ABC-2 type transport system ATP-binding protein
MVEKESFIQFQNVIKRFGKKVVLAGINLDIPYGERFGIIGISGSGKTTLLNILIGFLKPNAGKIYYKSKDITRHHANIRKDFGFAAQDGSFYSKLSVMENLNYFGKLYNMGSSEIKERSKSILRLVELEDHKDLLAEELSIGMQCRLDLACAMLHNPKVLVLDEPTEGLDPALRKEILLLLKKINESGTTLVITSHLLKEMEAICTKIAILHNGQIIETGTTNQLRSLYYKNDEIHLETSPGNYEKIAKRLSKKDIQKIEVKEHKIVIYTPKAEKVLKNILSTIHKLKESLVDIDVAKPSLEEVFETLTKK